jgi:hypothetical protein
LLLRSGSKFEASGRQSVYGKVRIKRNGMGGGRAGWRCSRIKKEKEYPLKIY